MPVTLALCTTEMATEVPNSAILPDIKNPESNFPIDGDRQFLHEAANHNIRPWINQSNCWNQEGMPYTNIISGLRITIHHIYALCNMQQQTKIK